MVVVLTVLRAFSMNFFVGGGVISLRDQRCSILSWRFSFYISPFQVYFHMNGVIVGFFANGRLPRARSESNLSSRSRSGFLAWLL